MASRGPLGQAVRGAADGAPRPRPAGQPPVPGAAADGSAPAVDPGPESGAVRFALLGPLEVSRDGARLDVGPPKRRILLLRLLLAGGHPVGIDELCEDLWNGRPPAGAVSSVHAHISRLRAVLEPGRLPRQPAVLLASGPAGYTLDAVPEARDTVLFEQAVERAHAWDARGRTAEARAEADAALRLWRGAPLADARNHRFAVRETARLEELRCTAMELRAAALLRQGEPGPAVLAAEDLIARDPLREAAWVLLMRALYFAGRPAEALQRYERVRVLLAEDLGLDPSPALRETQLAVLRHDTAELDPPAEDPSCALRPASSAPEPGGAAAPDVPDAAGVPAAAEGPADGPDGPEASDGPSARVPGTTELGGRSPSGGPPRPVDGPSRGPRVPGQRVAPRAGVAVAAVPAATGAHPLPFVGRHRELTDLFEALLEAASGRTVWTTVSGEPGAGRTRLAEEAAAQAADAGFAVHWSRFGRSEEGGRAVPEAVERLLREAPGADGPAGPAPPPAEAPVRPLAAPAGRPTLWVVDDVHRAEDAFHRVLARCAATVRDVALMVLCTVPDPSGPGSGPLAEALARRGAGRITLGPLPLPAVSRLLELTATGVGAAPGAGAAVPPAEPPAATARDDEAEELRRLSGGVPFLLAELLRLPSALRSGGTVHVPPGASALLRSRLAGTDRSVLRLLEAAAVIGDRVGLDVLAEAGRARITDTRRLAGAAVERGLLSRVPEAAGRPEAYCFAPPLLRHVVLAGLRPSRRFALHAAAAAGAGVPDNRERRPVRRPAVPQGARPATGSAPGGAPAPGAADVRRPGAHGCPGGRRR